MRRCGDAFNPLECTGNYSATSNCEVGTLAVDDGLLRSVQRKGGWAEPGPRVLPPGEFNDITPA